MNKPLITRHQVSAWTAIASVIAVGLVLAAPTFVSGQPRPPAAAERNAGDRALRLTATQYTRLQRVRQAAGLTADELALLDADPDNAEAALRELAGWVRGQARALDAAEANARRTRAQERAALRRTNIGPRDDRQLTALPQIREAARAAETARRALYRQGGEVAAARLRPDVRADRARLRPSVARTERPTRQAVQAREAFTAARRPAGASDSRAVQTRRAAYLSKRPLMFQMEQDLLPVPAELDPVESELTAAELRALETAKP